MKFLNRKSPFIVIAILVFSAIACALPGKAAPTPFAFPTPNLTMTAFFNAVTEIVPPPTVTPAGAANVAPQATPTFPLTFPPTAPATQPSTQPAQPTTPPTAVPPTAIPPTSPPLPTATSSLAGPVKRSSPRVFANLLSTPPNIDGYIEEWSQPQNSMGSVVYGKSNWQDAADLSGFFMIGWDQQYLYIAARIKDERYVQNATGVSLYLGDSLEVLLDTQVSPDYYQTSLSGDDYQLGISPGKPTVNSNPEAFLWFPRSRQGTQAQVKVAAIKTTPGYDVEIAIPWSVFRVTPVDGLHLGFTFSASDNDIAGDQVQQTMISNAPKRYLTNPTTWGDLTLVTP